MKNQENLLIKSIIEHFSCNNIFKIYQEVAFLSKRIDLVLVNNEKNKFYAIETKVNWWKKAIEQAKLSLLCADKVYIAMPNNKIHLLKYYKDYFNIYGIGLFSVFPPLNHSFVKEIIPATQSIYKGIYYENILKHSVEKGLYFRSI